MAYDPAKASARITDRGEDQDTGKESHGTFVKPFHQHSTH